MPESADDPAPRGDVVDVHVDERGILRMTWAPGTRVTEARALDAVALADRATAGRVYPVLVDMTGSITLTREARLIFARGPARRIAVLGRSVVDRVVANFAMGVAAAPPTRYFTSETAATAWLLDQPPGT